jgi:hypothetical protein
MQQHAAAGRRLSSRSCSTLSVSVSLSCTFLLSTYPTSFPYVSLSPRDPQAPATHLATRCVETNPEAVPTRITPYGSMPAMLPVGVPVGLPSSAFVHCPVGCCFVRFASRIVWWPLFSFLLFHHDSRHLSTVKVRQW